MHRVSITVEPAVWQLLKIKGNRSKYISDLILQDAYEAKKDALLERTKQALIKDKDFLNELSARLRPQGPIPQVPLGSGVQTVTQRAGVTDVRYTTPEDIA